MEAPFTQSCKASNISVLVLKEHYLRKPDNLLTFMQSTCLKDTVGVSGQNIPNARLICSISFLLQDEPQNIQGRLSIQRICRSMRYLGRLGGITFPEVQQQIILKSFLHPTLWCLMQ